ncbi:MAG UNVERIFIED_CONTAM: hypothetical protein LVR18_32650 [Planctomycetaceae bacterium]
MFDTSDPPGDALRDLLGYLNFSQGAPSARFRICLNELFRNPACNSRRGITPHLPPQRPPPTRCRRRTRLLPVSAG